MTALRRLLALGLALTVLTTAMPVRAAEGSDACAVADEFANARLLDAMRRGVNLPGWDSEDESQRPTTAQLEALREKGFTHIRLLLDAGRLAGGGRAAYLEEMFEEIILLFSLDYAVSLDLHAGNLFREEPETAEDHLADFWRAIAARVRHLDPEKLAVELLNEPQTDSATWWPIAGRLAAEIRRVLPAHTIVVGPAGPQRHEELARLEPLPDPNVVYAVHYYDPFAFTHQGADWGGADDPIQYLGDLPFPAMARDADMEARVAELKAKGREEAATLLRRSLETPWTEDAMKPAFDMMAEWSARHGRPVIVNEFGVLSYHAPRQSRLDWLGAVRRQAEARCIGWTHWDFQDGFGLIDAASGMPDEGVMDALAPQAD